MSRKNSWSVTAQKAEAYDAKIKANVSPPLPKPNSVVLYLLTVPAGVFCTYLVFSVQLGKPQGLANAGLLLFSTLLYLAHWWDPSPRLNKTVTTPTPVSFSHYFGPYAAQLANSFFWSMLIVNVLWAYRWLAGVEFVCKSVYNLKPELVKNLTECGAAHPFVEKGKTCHVLGSFLNKPLALYLHAAGAVSSLALGPFQFWGAFRKKYATAHRVMGYLYAICVVLGTVGAGMLISQTTSGALVAIGFAVLAAGWIAYLAIAIYHIKNGRWQLHKEYVWMHFTTTLQSKPQSNHLFLFLTSFRFMIRQYMLTFSAVPFRFLPAVLQGFGIDPETAYWAGAYLTVIWGYVYGEVFVRYLRRIEHPGELLSDDGLSMAEINPTDKA